MDGTTRTFRVLLCTAGLIGVAGQCAGCATSEKSVYERHLHSTLKADAGGTPTALFIGSSQVINSDALAAVDTDTLD